MNSVQTQQDCRPKLCGYSGATHTSSMLHAYVKSTIAALEFLSANPNIYVILELISINFLL